MSTSFTEMIPQWVLLPLIFIIPFLSFLLRKNPHRGLNLPPGPPRLPVLGHLHLLAGRNPHQALFKLSNKYGPAMLLQLGCLETLVVSSADMAREVLQTHDADFCSRPHGSPGAQKLSYGYLDVALAPHSDFRTRMKKLFSFELMKVKRDQTLSTARVHEMNKMINNLTQLGSTSVNLNDHIFAAVDGIVGRVAFGKSYGATQFNGKNFQAVMDEYMKVLGSFTSEDFYPGRIGWFIDGLTGYRARMETTFADLDGYFTMVIAEHLDPNKRPRPETEDFVDVLLRLSREADREFKLSMDHIKSLDAFIGGVDTTSVSIVWAMSELLMHPSVFRKATSEVRSVVGTKHMVDELDLEQLKYIKCIVKEIFRLHPAAPLCVPHEAIRSTKIGHEGYDVLEKTRIIVNAWAVGRDPAYWTDPENFNPERFEDSNVDFKGGHFQLIPFSSGRRICPGIDMGSVTITYVLANLLHCFDWEFPEGVQRKDVCMEEEGGLTMHKKTPLIVVPTRVS